MATSISLPPPEAIDAVIFDAGGVLLLPDPMFGQLALRTLQHESRPGRLASRLLQRQPPP